MLVAGRIRFVEGLDVEGIDVAEVGALGDGVATVVETGDCREDSVST